MAGRHLQNVTDNSVIQVASQRINIRRILIHNNDASPRFFRLFNAASGDVTLDSTTEDLIIQIGADTTEDYPFDDMEFDTGFSYAITDSESGTTGPTSCWVAISYI